MKKSYCLFFTLILFLFSCQTEIEVKVPAYYNKLVVEAYIENDQYPMITLSRSVPYFSTMTMEYLRDSVIIRDAKVFVTPSGGQSYELFMNPIFAPDLTAPLLYRYSTQDFKGELNTSYTLRIEWNNKVYTSTTAILNTFDLDSVAFVPNFGNTEIDSTANLRIWMTDNGQNNNYYQFKVRIRNTEFQDHLWVTTIPAAFDNSPFKGQSFNYEIIRGAPSTVFMPEMSEREMRNYLRMNYRIGDTVYLKYARLDYGGYQFWQTASGELTFGQNPFMSPTPIVSNITCSTGEKCLGVWCGSAAKERRLVFDDAIKGAFGK